MKNQITKIIICLLLLAPLSASAFSWGDFWGNDDDFDVRSSQTATEEVVVENNVSVSASTGGNTATSGTIQTGEAKARVQVRTEVNGEVLEDFVQEFSGDTDFEQKFEHATGTASTTTNIRVKTGSSTKSDLEFLQVRLEKNKDGATTTIATSTMATSTKVLSRHFNERISNWFAKLFKNVFSIFKK